MEQKVNQDFDQEIALIKHDDPFKNARFKELENKKLTDIDSLECLKKKEKRKKKRKIKDDFDVRTENLLSNKKVKTIINFENNECNSIKSLVVKGNTTIDVSSRFIKGKMLIFAKLSIKSFVYDMIDVFCFPNEEIQRIYDYYEIEKCFLYQNLTDTDSTSSLFTFICKFESSIQESKARDVIFDCMKKSKILNRLDLSHEFWKKYDVYDYSTKK